MTVNVIMRQHLVNSLIGHCRVSNLSFLIAPMGMGKTTLMFQAVQSALKENSELVVRELKNNYSRDDLFSFCARLERLHHEGELLIVVDDLIDLNESDLHLFHQFILKMLDRNAIILISLTPAQSYILENFTEYHSLKTSDLKLLVSDLSVWTEHFKIFHSDFDKKSLYAKIPYLVQAFACSPEKETLDSESFQRAMLELLTSFFLDEGLVELQELAYMLIVLGEGKISDLSYLFNPKRFKELLLYLHRFHAYFSFDWSSDSFISLPLALSYVKEIEIFVEFDVKRLLREALSLCVKNQEYHKAYKIYTLLGDEAKPQELVGLDPLGVIQKAPSNFLKAYTKDCLHNYKFPSPEDAVSNLILSLRFSDFRLKSVVLSLLEQRKDSTDEALLEIAYLALSLHEFLKTGELTSEGSAYLKTLPCFIESAKDMLAENMPQHKSAFLEQLYEIEKLSSGTYIKKLYLALASCVCIVSGLYHEGVSCIVKEGSYELSESFIDALLALNFTLLSYLSYVPDGMSFELPLAFKNAKKFFINALYQDMIYYAYAFEMYITHSRAQSMYRSAACKAINVAARRSENLIYRICSLMACEDDYALGAYQRGISRVEQANNYFSARGYKHMMAVCRQLWSVGMLNLCSPAQIEQLLYENLKSLNQGELLFESDETSSYLTQPLGTSFSLHNSLVQDDRLYRTMLIFEVFAQLAFLKKEEEFEAFVAQHHSLLWNPAFRNILVKFHEFIPALRKQLSLYLPPIVFQSISRGESGSAFYDMHEEQAGVMYQMRPSTVFNTDICLQDMHTLADFERSEEANLAMNKVYIQVLGSFDLRYGSEHIQDGVFNKRRVMQLLIYLSIHYKKGARRSEIIEELWPHLGYSEGRNNLYSTLSSLKSKLKPYLGYHELIISQNNYLKLNSDLVVIDLAELELIVRVLKTEKNKLSPAQILSLSLRLDKIYRGNLVEIALEEPVSFEGARESFKQSFIDAMLMGYQAALSGGDTTIALYFAQKAYEIDQHREDVIIALMKSYMMNARRPEAVEIYLSYMQYQTREFGLEPSEQLQLLYTQLIKGKTNPEENEQITEECQNTSNSGEDDEDVIESIAS